MECHGKTHKYAIPASCGIYYFEVTIVSEGRELRRKDASSVHAIPTSCGIYNVFVFKSFRSLEIFRPQRKRQEGPM